MARQTRCHSAIQMCTMNQINIVFDYDNLLIFAPSKHEDLRNNQRRFLMKLKHILRNNAFKISDSRWFDMHQILKSIFLYYKLDHSIDSWMWIRQFLTHRAWSQFFTFSLWSCFLTKYSKWIIPFKKDTRNVKHSFWQRMDVHT